jgi:predicted DNA-binding transcriptional regulator AlpA
MFLTKLSDLDPDQYIRAPHVSGITGVKASTLAQWRYAGDSPIPYSKIGKRLVVYRLGDVLDYVKAQRVGGFV